MTNEELVKKYEFLEGMTENNIKKLMMFMLISMMDISLNNGKNEESKIAIFMDDVTTSIKR